MWEYSDSSECYKTVILKHDLLSACPLISLCLEGKEAVFEAVIYRQAIASGDIKMSSDENICNSINLIWIWNAMTIQGRQLLV